MLKRFWGRDVGSSVSLVSMTVDAREGRLLNASKALEMLMDEDFEGADIILGEHDDAFHLAGRALSLFIKAISSFDKEEITDATRHLEIALAACESEASHTKTLPDSRFTGGSELGVTIALLLLQLSITGFMSESMTEAVKAVWKMRRSYNILYGLNHHLTIHNITLDTKHNVHTPSEKFGEVGNSDKVDPGDRRVKRVTTNQLNLAAGMHSELGQTDHFVACSTLAGYGMISLIISITPPAVSRILSVIGFKGSKVQALEDLWAVADAPNILGAMALLGLLSYHVAIAASCDIMPDETVQNKRLSDVLDATIARYPNSTIFKLQKAKLLGQIGNLQTSITLLETITADSQLKQVRTLKLYDLGFAYIATQQWEKAIDRFTSIESKDIWSKAVFHYIVGSCFVELYRDTGDTVFADQAQIHLQEAPGEAGKKKVMGKELSLEVYIKRKVSKWRVRAAGKPFVEVITVSPILEFCHLFNYWKKMGHNQQLRCLALLGRSSKTADTLDDRLTRLLVSASLKRRSSNWQALEDLAEATSISLPELKSAPHTEIWAVPFTYYEYAACLWQRDGRKNFTEVRKWLEKAKNFGSSEMDQLLAVRLTVALQTIAAD